ncbi:HAD family hydrolase [Flavobacterium sp.]|jgi:HAD superfamily hydrolase (TIGR01490 family)|uniref:HAD family hydrolase n=1 Tax=Flavobacterium sp. TaxID=239 RepID=UPI0037C04A04
MKNNLKNLVIFDFCETLVDLQTADFFVDYIIKKEKYYQYLWLKKIDFFLKKSRILAVINKCFPKFNFSKRLKLYQIKGVSQEKVNQLAQDYYEEILMNNLIEPVYQLLESHSKNNDTILIISGGYLPYVKYFSEKHHIENYFATKIAYRFGKITGNFDESDCMFDQKVYLLEKFINETNIIYSKSIVYSDSITDLPLLKWADEAVVISKSKSQLWANDFGFKEIIH